MLTYARKGRDKSRNIRHIWNMYVYRVYMERQKQARNNVSSY
jgi:hypothetical protein